MGGKKATEIYNQWNSVRNQLKHHGDTDDESITIKMFDEAYWMIKRALENAKKLAVSINNESEFENWVIVNIHM